MKHTILTDESIPNLFLFLSICTLSAKSKVSDKLFLQSYTSISKCEGTIQGAEPVTEVPSSLTITLI